MDSSMNSTRLSAGQFFLNLSHFETHMKYGGGTRIRTGDNGFADRRLSHLAMPPPSYDSRGASAPEPREERGTSSGRVATPEGVVIVPRLGVSFNSDFPHQ